MSDISETTRESAFYDEVLQSRVVNEVDGETYIENMSGVVSWKATVSGKASTLIPFAPARSEQATVSRDTYTALQSLRARPSEELADIARGMSASTVGTARWKGKITQESLQITAFLTLSLPDGSDEVIRVEQNVDGYESPIASLARASEGNVPVSATTIDDGYRVTVEGISVAGQTASPSRVRSTAAFDQLCAYYRAQEPVVAGSVKLRDDEEKAYVDVRIRDETVRFSFDRPSSDESGFWDIVDAVGVAGDPLSINNEEMYVARDVLTDHAADDALAAEAGWLLFADRPSNAFLSLF